MREIGVVKWFGGANYKTNRQNEFGFISRENNDDLYFHKREVNFAEEYLREGTFVTFEVGTNVKTGKLEARKIGLLTDEIDKETIEFCLNSRNKKLWNSVLDKYLRELSPEEAAAFVLKKITLLPSLLEKRQIIRTIPTNVFLHSKALRELLPIDEHLEYCLSALIKRNFDPQLFLQFKEELLGLFSNYSSEAKRKKVPFNLLCIDKDFRALLTPKEHFDILLKILDETHAQQDKLAIYHEALELLNKVPYTAATILSKIPVSLFKEYKELRDQLPPVERINCILELLETEMKSLNKGALIGELRQCLEKQSTVDIWSMVPQHVLQDPIISPLIPPYFLATILMKKWSRYQEITVIQELKLILSKVSRKEQLKILQILPADVKVESSIFSYLPAIEQVNLIWNSIETSGWLKLSSKAKILAVYRAAQYNENLGIVDHLSSEMDKLVKCALMLLAARHNHYHLHKLFQDAHTLLQEYVTDVAWSSTAPLDLDPLLPRCSYGHVTYCEGRIWREKDESLHDAPKRAFCPRTNGPCQAGIEGARLTANCQQVWYRWTLLELIESVGIKPSLPENQLQGVCKINCVTSQLI